MQRNNAVVLILSRLMGLSDAKQDADLQEWLRREENARLHDEMTDKKILLDSLDEFERYDARADWHKVAPQLASRRSRIPRVALYGAAAALAFGVFMHFLNAERKHNAAFHASGKSEYLSQIKPGNAKASLIVDDGAVIYLGDSAITLPQAEVNAGGEIVYNDAAPEEQVRWHTLQIPRGGEYTVVLPDKTVVHMNANSKLQYPTRFATESREVILSGEAYFEVSHNPARPFIVRTEGMEIKVLGTSFNVKAYPDESLQTTLVEGSLRVTTSAGSVKIVPGEQALFDEGRLTVRQVDLRPYLSQRYERFLFDDDLLADVLRKIERWYDIEIFVADQSVYGLRFTGNLPKYEELSKVLRVLELTTNIRFNLLNKRLTVEQELPADKTAH